MGKVVTLQELAEITGFAQQTLIRWQKSEGMPVMLAGQRGKGNEYDTEAVIAWFAQRELVKAQKESPKDRLDNKRADMLELQIAEKCGHLIVAAEAESLWVSVVTSAGIELDSFGDELESRLRARSIDVTDLGIRDMIRDMRNRLESLELPDVDEPEAASDFTEDAA